MGDKLLTISQAARLLDISQNTLRAWADRGLVPVVRTPSGQRRFYLDDVERLMATTTTPLMGAPPPAEREGAGS